LQFNRGYFNRPKELPYTPTPQIIEAYVDVIMDIKAKVFSVDLFLDEHGILTPLGLQVRRETSDDLIPEIEEQYAEIPGRHGRILLGGRLGPRTFNLVVNTTEMEREKLDLLEREIAAHFNPTMGPKTLSFHTDAEKVFYVRYSGQIAVTQYPNWLDFTIPLVATDPYAYGHESVLYGDGTINNRGALPAPLLITVRGPVSGSVDIQLGDQSVKYDDSLASGDVL